MPSFTWKPFVRRDEVAANEVPATAGAVRMETFAQAYEDTPLLLGAMLDRYQERREALGFPSRPRSPAPKVDVITPEEAAKMVSDSGMPLPPYSGRVTRQVVELDIERKRQEIKRQDILSRSPGGVGLGLTNFAISAGTTMADPVGMGLNFVPVVNQAKYAKWLASAGTIASPFAKFAARSGVRAGVGAVEGAVGAALYEPLLYSAKQYELADYDMVDSLVNVGMGGAIGSLGHVTIGGFADAYRAMRTVPRETPKTFKDAIKSAQKHADEPITTTDIETGGKHLGEKLDRVIDYAAPGIKPPPKVDIEVSADGREFTFRTKNGETIAMKRGDKLQVIHTETAETAQKTGEGAARQEAVIAEANRQGLQVVSDTRVSPAAAKIYDRLERNGYTVKRNGFVLDEEGHLVSDAGRPVFEVSGTSKTTAARMVSTATPQQHEAAMRTANMQQMNGEPVDVGAIYGDKNAVKASPEHAETEAASREAEEAMVVHETLEEAVEDADVTRRQADAYAKQMEVEPDPEMKAADKYLQQIERWTRAAELAQVCLVRGG